MKHLRLFLLFLVFATNARAQTFYGYTIADYLVDAVHPKGCSPNYVTGPPDDSTWVNFKDGDVMTGTFGSVWTDKPWAELLLETSYHRDNYTVSLLLSTGLYSATHDVFTGDWTQIPDTPWVHLFTSCSPGRYGSSRYILPLDFVADFGLTATDVVQGVRIEFRTTTGDPDLAGIYIVTQAPPVTLNLGRDTTLCQGQSLLLNAAMSNATYLWQDNSTGSSYTVTQPGTYWVRVNANNTTYRDTITIGYKPLPVFTLGKDTALCAGNNFTLNATTANASYLWQNNSTAQTYTVTQAGTYWTQVTVNGCAKKDTINVSYRPLPAVNLGRDTILCEGIPLILDATTANATYLWQDNSTQTTYTATQAGTYWVRVTVNQCSSADTLQLSYSPAPTLNLGRDTMLCPGDTLMLDASFPNATYTWQDNSTSPVFSVTQAGTYWVRASLNGCRKTDSVLVRLQPALVLNLGPDSLLCEGETVVLNATNTNATYLWQDGSGNATLLVSEPGTYWVQVRSCQTLSDTVAVDYENCLCALFWPNAFTPNADGLNDAFAPIGSCPMDAYRFLIFNRWGEKVFESSTPGQAWDGSYGGKPAPIEDYVYLVLYRFEGEQEELQDQGRVTLIR